MDEFPEELPETGTTLGPIYYHGTDYTFQGVSDGHWLIEGPVGIRTEISREDDGSLSLVRTDGKTSQSGAGDDWSELAAMYF